MSPQAVAVLGSTGSIGRNTLDVLARHPGRWRVAALTANTDVECLREQCLRFRPRYAAMAHPPAAQALARSLGAEGCPTAVLAGPEALERLAALEEVGQVMAAIVGAAGLLPTLAAVRAGKRVLLANKEALVMSGAILMEAVRRHGATLLPIDSEHNAIFQCLPGGAGVDLAEAGVRRILLTASGGPFRETAVEALADVTPEQACAHPNWVMGRKISVDSATLMNKGLELIEACRLFDARPRQVEVVIHPQSVIHSMVEYADGSVLAQMGHPDMRTPIAHALAWPERVDAGVAPLDLFTVARLDFQRPDLGRFPCLGLAYRALERGGAAPAVLNAANEVAVAAFLDGDIRFTDIPRLIGHVLETVPAARADTVEAVLDADVRARGASQAWLAGLAAGA